MRKLLLEFVAGQSYACNIASENTFLFQLGEDGQVRQGSRHVRHARQLESLLTDLLDLLHMLHQRKTGPEWTGRTDRPAFSSCVTCAACLIGLSRESQAA